MPNQVKRIEGPVLHRVRARHASDLNLEEIFSTTSKADALAAVDKMKLDPDYADVFYIDPEAHTPTKEKTDA